MTRGLGSAALVAFLGMSSTAVAALRVGDIGGGGSAQVQRPAGAWELAVVGMPVGPGDKVYCGPGTEVTLECLIGELVEEGGGTIGAVFQMRPDTMLLFTSEQEAAGVCRIEVLLKGGAIGAQVQPATDGSTVLKVRTPTGAVEVTGTQIREIAYGPATGMKVRMGLSGVLRVLGARAGEVRLTSGQDSRVRDQRSLPSRPIDEVVDSRQSLLSPKGTTRTEEEDIRDLAVPRPLIVTGQGGQTREVLPRVLVQQGTRLRIPVPRLP